MKAEIDRYTGSKNEGVVHVSIFSWDGDNEVCDADWQEIAFVKAWGRGHP